MLLSRDDANRVATAHPDPALVVDRHVVLVGPLEQAFRRIDRARFVPAREADLRTAGRGDRRPSRRWGRGRDLLNGRRRWSDDRLRAFLLRQLLPQPHLQLLATDANDVAVLERLLIVDFD